MHVVEAVGMSVYFVLLASWCAGDSKFSQTLFGQWICRSQQELLQYKDEKPELLEYLDATSLVSYGPWSWFDEIESSILMARV